MFVALRIRGTFGFAPAEPRAIGLSLALGLRSLLTFLETFQVD